MALSLNEGSWGLLLDPLNGTADISARQLRLVSNYGFLEDPIRLVRAVRLMSRTGWDMEERTKARYDNAKAEGVISALTAVQRGYELEGIGYEKTAAGVESAGGRRLAGTFVAALEQPLCRCAGPGASARKVCPVVDGRLASRSVGSAVPPVDGQAFSR